jgi:hypothetical protein
MAAVVLLAVEERRGERSGPGTETGIHVGAGSMLWELDQCRRLNGAATDPVEKLVERVVSWHLLVSQVGLHFQQEYPSSLPASPIFLFYL